MVTNTFHHQSLHHSSCISSRYSFSSFFSCLLGVIMTCEGAILPDQEKIRNSKTQQTNRRRRPGPQLLSEIACDGGWQRMAKTHDVTVTSIINSLRLCISAIPSLVFSCLEYYESLSYATPAHSRPYSFTV